MISGEADSPSDSSAIPRVVVSFFSAELEKREGLGIAPAYDCRTAGPWAMS